MTQSSRILVCYMSRRALPQHDELFQAIDTFTAANGPSACINIIEMPLHLVENRGEFPQLAYGQPPLRSLFRSHGAFDCVAFFTGCESASNAGKLDAQSTQCFVELSNFH